MCVCVCDHSDSPRQCTPRHNGILTLHPTSMELNPYLLHTCAHTYAQSTYTRIYIHALLHMHMRASTRVNAFQYQPCMHLCKCSHIHKYAHTYTQRMARLWSGGCLVAPLKCIFAASALKAQQVACALDTELLICWPVCGRSIASAVRASPHLSNSA